MFGFNVYNALGEVVVDSSHLGYSLVFSGQIDVVSESPSVIIFSTAIKSQSPPIICVQVKQFNNSWIRLCKVLGEPGNWTGFRVIGSRINNSHPHLGVSNYRVYASGIGASNTWGLRVLNSVDQVVFDSGLRQLTFEDYAADFNWPLYAEAADGIQKILVYRNVNLVIPADSWLPLSMINHSYTTTHMVQSRERVMEVEVCWGWLSGNPILIIWLYSSTVPAMYNVPVTSFCPFVLN